MASTLTYDPSNDPQYLAEEDARDQESYEIGDRLQQEQDQLLAGKYRDAEELEQAYLELQRKLGSRSPEAEEAQQAQSDDDVDDSEDLDYSFLDQLASEAESGTFSPETIQALEQMSAADIADMFLAYRQANEGEPSDTYQISQEDVSELKGVVGGEAEYQQMIAWAAQNLTPQEIQVYDNVMDKGDPQAIYFAIQALNYRYQDSVGVDGRLLTGNAAQSQDVFRSQAEVVRAMNDPRYENDPAYRQDIYNKLERSNLQF